MMFNKQLLGLLVQGRKNEKKLVRLGFVVGDAT